MGQIYSVQSTYQVLLGIVQNLMCVFVECSGNGWANQLTNYVRSGAGVRATAGRAGAWVPDGITATGHLYLPALPTRHTLHLDS
jgi:hypothetical protein